MQDAFAYCTDLVRQADRDRYLAALFAPERERAALMALYAFDQEIRRVPEAAREALAGEIRLQWWTEVIGGERPDEASGNPVAAALLEVIERYRLPTPTLSDFVEAHRSDLYDEPMAAVADLENYMVQTASAVTGLAAQILGAAPAPAAKPAGIAWGVTEFLRAFPLQAAQHRVMLPTELSQRHGITVEDLTAKRASRGLDTALAEIRNLARRQLAAAGADIRALPAAALPAFLPIALVRPWLDRLERRGPFVVAEISPWRRQWLIWRAAHNPARIAG